MRKTGILRDLADEVRERRQHRKLSQEALAHQAGIHTNVVGRLEGGSYNPTVLTLLAIAEKLGASPAELFAATAKRREESQR
jgi:transcriptional regulator with XRE-family HTH domain